MKKLKSGVPPYAICFFKDGDMWCCVFGDFINLQESPAGFGITHDAAFGDLQRNYEEWKRKNLEKLQLAEKCESFRLYIDLAKKVKKCNS